MTAGLAKIVASNTFFDVSEPTTLKGLRYSRWAGILVGVLVLGFAALRATRQMDGVPNWFLGMAVSGFVLFGLCLLLPYGRIAKRRLWQWAFGGLCLAATAFVFLNIIDVLFLYEAIAAQGEKPGVPGFRALMIFVGLLQVPTVLFQRYPQMLD
ncbi:MAG: hypothetical protein ACFBZ8_07835 [Opitutales bacterium]